MKTIGQLAKSVGLSRGTLLHYDKIGLLIPSARTESNYRAYSQEDVQRLEQIMIYREAGLPLEKICELLATPQNESVSLLVEQLEKINQQIAKLRLQQQTILSLVGNKALVENGRVLNKAQWVAILKSAGWSEADMHHWHHVFERDYPQAHQNFLESLGIKEVEIKKIREESKG